MHFNPQLEPAIYTKYALLNPNDHSKFFNENRNCSDFYLTKALSSQPLFVWVVPRGHNGENPQRPRAPSGIFPVVLVGPDQPASAF